MRLECARTTPAQCLSCPLVETSNLAKVTYFRNIMRFTVILKETTLLNFNL